MISLPVSVMLSTEIIDLPPKEVLSPKLTNIQIAWWLQVKLKWTDIYYALIRYFSGQAIAEPEMSSLKRERLAIEVQSVLKLYSLLNFGWGEIIEGSKHLNDMPGSPGEMLLLLLRNRALAEYVVCLDEFSFSSQVAYRCRSKWMQKKAKHSGTDRQLALLELEYHIVKTLEKSNSSAVKNAVKEYKSVLTKSFDSQRRDAHPRKPALPGGRWKDGVWIPSQKHVRNRSNLPDEN